MDVRFRARRSAGLALVLSLALLFAVATTLAQAPAAPQRTFNPQDTLPFDPAVHTATLPNGLKYFVRQNSRPAKRVSLRLAVRAGSVYEADDQQGLAHLIEHMAFNGSAHFKPGELVSYFESIGARLGPHVNAYTCFDETVYMLDVPSDKPEVVEKALTALADFAGGLSLTPDGSGQGTRRRHRRMARRPRRQLARTRQAAADPVLSIALCGAPADRQTRHHPQRTGRAGCAPSTTPGIARNGWP